MFKSRCLRAPALFIYITINRMPAGGNGVKMKVTSNPEYARDLLFLLAEKCKENIDSACFSLPFIADKETRRLCRKYHLQTVCEALCGQMIEDENESSILEMILLKRGNSLSLVVKRNKKEIVIDYPDSSIVETMEKIQAI